MVTIVLSSADNSGSVSMGGNVSLIGVGELSDVQGSSLGMVSDEVRLIFQAMNFAVICQLMDVFGTCTNIVNVVVFVKQGFKDSVNVSLMGTRNLKQWSINKMNNGYNLHIFNIS